MEAMAEADCVCFEKARLLREYKSAVADYNRAVQVLSLRADVMTKAEFVEIHAFSEKARLRSTLASLQLQQHTVEHTC